MLGLIYSTTAETVKDIELKITKLPPNKNPASLDIQDLRDFQVVQKMGLEPYATVKKISK